MENKKDFNFKVPTVPPVRRSLTNPPDEEMDTAQNVVADPLPPQGIGNEPMPPRPPLPTEMEATVENDPLNRYYGELPTPPTPLPTEREATVENAVINNIIGEEELPTPPPGSPESGEPQGGISLTNSTPKPNLCADCGEGLEDDDLHCCNVLNPLNKLIFDGIRHNVNQVGVDPKVDPEVQITWSNVQRAHPEAAYTCRLCQLRFFTKLSLLGHFGQVHGQ